MQKYKFLIVSFIFTQFFLPSAFAADVVCTAKGGHTMDKFYYTKDFKLVEKLVTIIRWNHEGELEKKLRAAVLWYEREAGTEAWELIKINTPENVNGGFVGANTVLGWTFTGPFAAYSVTTEVNRENEHSSQVKEAKFEHQYTPGATGTGIYTEFKDGECTIPKGRISLK